MKKLFCFGLGFSALALARRARADGWAVAGTCRTEGKRGRLAADGIAAHLFDDSAPLTVDTLAGATHVLVSVPPGADGCPVLDRTATAIASLDPKPAWIGYLSTTGVYGDTGGAEVTEESPLAPTSPRGTHRVAAETAWRAFGRETGIPVQVFRLAGIYGPGRSTLDQVRHGSARRIDKPGHRFSRIHVDDIAAVLWAAMARPDAGPVFNVCDDEPAPQADVVAEACRLLKQPPPPLVPFAEASPAMSEMARSFWRDNRIVSNARMKAELGVTLAHPTYREGLAAVLKAGE